MPRVDPKSEMWKGGFNSLSSSDLLTSRTDTISTRQLKQVEQDIKQEPAQILLPRASITRLSNTNVTKDRVRELSQRIHDLIQKRKQHRTDTELRKKRIRQSQLTYADLIRKRNKLENSLRDLKLQLDSDEKLLQEELKCADEIPEEIEVVSAELASLCSS
jgi:chromosome segregation ATPase